MSTYTSTRKIALLTSVALGSFLVLHAGEFLVMGQQQPFAADIIVVLGGDSGERTLKAAALFQQGYASHILLMGYDKSRLQMHDYASRWQTEWLQLRKIPRDVICYDSVATNTFEEMQRIAFLLPRAGYSTAIIISDMYHVKRVQLVFALVVRDTLRCVCIGVSHTGWRTEKWWSDGRSIRVLLSEYMKLAWYFIRFKM